MAQHIKEDKAKMNDFTKTAYEAGVAQALQDFGLGKQGGFEGLGRAARNFEGLSSITDPRIVAKKNLPESVTQKALENISAKTPARVPDYLYDGNINPEGALVRSIRESKLTAQFNDEQSKLLKRWSSYLGRDPVLRKHLDVGGEYSLPLKLIREFANRQALINIGLKKDLSSRLQLSDNPVHIHHLIRAMDPSYGKGPLPDWLSRSRPT